MLVRKEPFDLPELVRRRGSIHWAFKIAVYSKCRRWRYPDFEPRLA